MVLGMELRNFRRGRHLYSAGRPSRWASAHILVVFFALHGQHIAPIKVKFDMEEPNFALFGAEMFVWDPVSCDIFGIFRL